MNPAETYINNQPEPYRAILMHVQAIIEHTLPEVDLKYKWSIPCYYVGKRPICYLNASHKNKFVDVAFWHSAYITKHKALLVGENRKVVKSLRYKSLEAINDTVLVDILKEIYTFKDSSFYNR